MSQTNTIRTHSTRIGRVRILFLEKFSPTDSVMHIFCHSECPTMFVEMVGHHYSALPIYQQCFSRRGGKTISQPPFVLEMDDESLASWLFRQNVVFAD